MPFTFGSYTVGDATALTAALAFDPACLANYDFGGTSCADCVDVADIGRMIGSRMVGMTAKVSAELITRARRLRGSSCPSTLAWRTRRPVQPCWMGRPGSVNTLRPSTT